MSTGWHNGGRPGSVAGVRRMSNPADRDRLRVDLAERLRARLPQALDAACTYMVGRVPDVADRHDLLYLPGWRDAVDACLRCGLLAIERGREWEEPIPAVALAQARRAARDGVGLDLVLERWSAAYEAAWDFVAEEIDAMPESYRAIVLGEASAATTTLLARLLVEVSVAHADELQRDGRSIAKRRGDMARRALTGRSVDRRELDYDLGAEHLGIIASGSHATGALELLAQRVGRRLLMMQEDEHTVGAWLGGATRLAPSTLMRHLQEGACTDVAFAVGLPARGARGYRRTYRQAQTALLVARRWPQPITLHEDVAILAQAVRDGDFEACLIETYIVPLEGDPDGQTLRRTLETFYACERDREWAGRTLEVERHTIKRRLARVGDLIGCPLDAHHVEMQAALKLTEP